MSTTNNSSSLVQVSQHDGKQVRTIVRNGEVLFCGKDVAKAFGYANSNKALEDHCKSDGVTNRYPIADALGRVQNTRFITQGDVIRLAASSKLPGAEKFESWIFDDLVPTVLKTGSYSLPAKAPESDEELLSRAVLVATNKIQRLETANRELASENETLRPKAVFADAVGAAENTLTMPQMAKILSSHGFPGGVVKLYRKLREDHVVYRRNGRNLPVQRYVDAGLFTARISPFEAKGHHYNGVTMLVTAKGSRWLAARYCPAAATPALEGSGTPVLDAAPVVLTWQSACFVEEERDYQGEGYPILHVFAGQEEADSWAATHNGRPIDRKQGKQEAGDIAGLRVEALGWTWDGSLNALRALPGSDDPRFVQAVADVYALDAGPWTGGITFHC